MEAIALGCVGVGVGSLAVIHLDGHEYPHLSAMNADERQAKSLHYDIGITT